MFFLWEKIASPMALQPLEHQVIPQFLHEGSGHLGDFLSSNSLCLISLQNPSIQNPKAVKQADQSINHSILVNEDLPDMMNL